MKHRLKRFVSWVWWLLITLLLFPVALFLAALKHSGKWADKKFSGLLKLKGSVAPMPKPTERQQEQIDKKIDRLANGSH